jgi:H+/gluconate symporter-like permease
MAFVAGTVTCGVFRDGCFALVDAVTAPTATAGFAKIFVDTADGDLKVIFGDGTTKVIVADT